MAWFRGKLAMFLLIFQAVFLVLFGVLVKYDPGADARERGDGSHNKYPLAQYYASKWKTNNYIDIIEISFLCTL